MTKKLTRLLLLFGAVAIISSSFMNCKSKTKDADIKTAVETALAANPDLKGLMVDVKDGIATITGEVKDAATQATVQTAVAAIKGVKSVQNNVSVVAPPPPPVQISADDPLTAAVKDATKDFPSVTATVKDGIVSVTGELKSDAWKKLKMALDGLKPKKVDATGLKIAK